MQIECPECSKMISDKADICPHCGYSLKKARDDKATGLGCMVFLVLAVALYFYIGSGNSTSDTQRKEREPNDITAFVMSQTFVKKNLVSPSSAKFPYSDEANIVQIDKVTWRVASYVDSQNKFGAMLRTRYQAKLMYLGAEKWKLLDLKFLE